VPKAHPEAKRCRACSVSARIGKPNPGGRYARSPETRKRNRDGRLGRTNSNDSKQRASSAHKTLWEQADYRAKFVKPKPPRPSHEERQRLWRDRVRDANLGRKDSPTRREKVRRGVLAAYAANPEIKDRLRAARLRQVFPRSQTRIERNLEDAFRAIGLARFLTQWPAFDRFQPDFTFPDARLFVQADGTYWHSLPKNRRLDHEFERVAAEHGWMVLRFSEDQIRRDPNICAYMVSRALAMSLLRAVSAEAAAEDDCFAEEILGRAIQSQYCPAVHQD
jgi:very-short-patch-repair endonuclease